MEFTDRAHPPLKIRRTLDPPKNAENQIYCDHPDCDGTKPTFRRPYEWNTHMDKHERPYKCPDLECKWATKGFTYPGGLVRHRQDAHKKTTETKNNLFCHHTGCKRSKRNPFKRNGNLQNHMRRCHMGTNALLSSVVTEPDLIITSKLKEIRTIASGAKRKLDSPGGDLLDEQNEDLHGEVERLDWEVQKINRRLEELERIVVCAQQVTSRTPQSESENKSAVQ
ncbi:uncharacterized protein N7483_002448 [Penicillium malachiteum]|uniref:uncharacterized protein n=1 Tax=Penicillium malachiteum TaxID=1324776 RepID=UPI002548A89B|nr:uncharacterized protein N7483_002448 [Penicillium malachiteum]KAJ5737323.1 hypothetical protein N7483_002448 [Penicillium malachiteum]